MPIDDNFDYNPVLLGFVIDVQWPHVNTVKMQLVESIRHMESDERAYTYSADNLTIPRWPGQSVADVANFHRFLDFNMPDGIKQTIILLSQEDFSFDKYLFVITDSYTEKQAHRVTRSLAWNEKEDCECNCYFLALGEDNYALKSLCTEKAHGYLHVPRADDVQEAITTIYRTQEMPFFVKNYQRLELYSLKRTFLTEEREQVDGCEADCEGPSDGENPILPVERKHYCPLSWGLRESDEADRQHSSGDTEQSLPDSSSG